MVNDQEPRYRLVDADGNVVGSLFAESDGTLKLQEGTSGNDNELSLTTQGALNVEQADVTTQLTTPVSQTTDKSGGSTHTFYRLRADGQQRAAQRFQLTTGVSTTATEVAAGFELCIADIFGKDDNNNQFADEVLWTFRGTPRVREQTTLEGSPASRSYDVTDDNLELTMGSDTYEIMAIIRQSA